LTYRWHNVRVVGEATLALALRLFLRVKRRRLVRVGSTASVVRPLLSVGSRPVVAVLAVAARIIDRWQRQRGCSAANGL